MRAVAARALLVAAAMASAMASATGAHAYSIDEMTALLSRSAEEIDAAVVDQAADGSARGLERLASDLDVAAAAQRTTVRLEIAFNPETLAIDGPTQARLIKLCVAMKRLDDAYRYAIDGHADPSEPDARAVSKRRAEAVAEYVDASCGFRASRVAIVRALGDARPLDGADVAENQRAEIYVAAR